MVIRRFIDKKIPLNYASAMLTSTSKSSTPYIEPSLFYYNNVLEIEIHMSNVTTRTELVYLNAVIFEVQPVIVDEFKTNARIITDVSSTIRVFFSEKEIRVHFYVFSTGNADVGHATDDTYMLELSDDHAFAE